MNRILVRAHAAGWPQQDEHGRERKPVGGIDSRPAPHEIGADPRQRLAVDKCPQERPAIRYPLSEKKISTPAPSIWRSAVPRPLACPSLAMKLACASRT